MGRNQHADAWFGRLPKIFGVSRCERKIPAMHQEDSPFQKPALVLRIVLPFPATARQFRSHLGGVLARCNTHLLGIFNHSDDGKNRNQTAMIRFSVEDSDEGSVGCIHALNSEAMHWLAQLKQIQMPDALSNMHLVSEPVGMFPSSSHAFRVRSLVVAKNATQYSLWQQSTAIQKRQRVSALLGQGLARQCAHLGLRQTASPEVTAIEHEWSEPKLLHKPANAHMRLCDALFTLSAQLRGSWAAGALNNRGHGCMAPLGASAC